MLNKESIGNEKKYFDMVKKILTGKNMRLAKNWNFYNLRDMEEYRDECLVYTKEWFSHIHIEAPIEENCSAWSQLKLGLWTKDEH